MTLQPFSLLSQKPRYEVFGKVKMSEGDPEGTRVYIDRDNQRVGNETIPRNGKFEFDLDYQADYILTFEKAGYITKSINVNTHIPDSEYQTVSYDPFEPFEFQVILFKQPEGTDIVVFNQPVAIIKYHSNKDDFDYDTDYSKTIQKRIDDIEKKSITKTTPKKMKERLLLSYKPK